MMKPYFIPIITNGCEVWHITEKELSRVLASELRLIRAIKREHEVGED